MIRHLFRTRFPLLRRNYSKPQDPELQLKLKQGHELYEKGFKMFQQNRLSEAQEFYKSAIALGNVQAINNLAVMYTEGVGVSKNYQIAKDLYVKGCELGDPNSLYNLARLLQLEGKYDEAVEVLTPSLQFGAPFASSITALGWLHTFHLSDPEKGREMYEIAVAYGHAPANTYLGDYYMNVQKDEKMARSCYESAAAEDDCRALTILSTMEIAEGNVSKGVEALEAAIELNYLPAINQLGVLYVKGHTTGDPKAELKPDYIKAADLFTKAMKIGDPQSMMNLAFLHLNGFGVEKNPERAIELLQAAIDHGSEEAKSILAKVKG